jgi:hypothetical protein
MNNTNQTLNIKLMMIQKGRNLQRPQTMSKFQSVQSSPNSFSFSSAYEVFFFTYDHVADIILQVQKDHKIEDLCQIVDAANDSEDSQEYIL